MMEGKQEKKERERASKQRIEERERQKSGKRDMRKPSEELQALNCQSLTGL